MVTVIQPKIDRQYKGIGNIAISKNSEGGYEWFSRPLELEFHYHLGLEVLNPRIQTIYVYKGIHDLCVSKLKNAMSKLKAGKSVDLERILLS